MKISKLLLVPLLAIAIVGCDSDSSTNAQEPISMDCPCFSKDDLIQAFKDAGGDVTCAIGGVGFTLDPGGPLGGVAEVGCKPNTNDCECIFENDVKDNLNFFQVEECLNHMFDALLDLEKEGIDFGGCSLNTIE